MKISSYLRYEAPSIFVENLRRSHNYDSIAPRMSIFKISLRSSYNLKSFSLPVKKHFYLYPLFYALYSELRDQFTLP